MRLPGLTPGPVDFRRVSAGGGVNWGLLHEAGADVRSRVEAASLRSGSYGTVWVSLKDRAEPRCRVARVASPANRTQSTGTGPYEPVAKRRDAVAWNLGACRRMCRRVAAGGGGLPNAWALLGLSAFALAVNGWGRFSGCSLRSRSRRPKQTAPSHPRVVRASRRREPRAEPPDRVRSNPPAAASQIARSYFPH